MPATKKTISQVLEEFLEDQAARLKPKTLAKYQTIVRLLQGYMESYWPGQDDQFSRVTKEGGTFCDTFGPEEILGGYHEFFGYFMPQKVMCGKETMQAAGTVTKKLAKWLAEKGYIEDSTEAEERAADAGRKLPAAQDALAMLDEFVAVTAPHNFSEEVDDHFWIERIEPGKLWLDPLAGCDGTIGPVPVPEEVTQIVEEMWDIAGVVVKTKRGWRFSDVWKVGP